MHNPRIGSADLDPMFTDRWSPRAFTSTPLGERQLASLLEAVRWAPSSSNRQPWQLVYAVSEADRRRFSEVLDEGNRVWAQHAPLLLFLAAEHRPPGSKRENSSAPFDCGAAWMSLALQARKLGLHSHAMGGFDRQRAHEVTDLPEDRFRIQAAIAVGYRADPADLPEHQRARERPSSRKPVAEIACEGRFASS